MMTKTQNKNTWKLFLLIPLGAILVFFNACTKQADAMPQKPESYALAQVDSPPQFNDCATDESQEAQMACFMNGLTKHVIANFKYPKEAAEANKTGKVFVQFTISKDGRLIDQKVARGIARERGEDGLAELMETAALEVFDDFPTVIPAQKGGKAVSVQYSIPIQFSLK